MKQLILFVFTVLMSVTTLAGDRFYKPTDKITFTYEEFRKLSASHQDEWIKELKNFNRNVDLIVDGQRLTAKKPKYWSFLEMFNIKPVNAGLCLFASEALAPSEAHAETQNKTCLLKKETKQQQAMVCVSCTSGGFELFYQCAPNERNNPNNAEVAAKRILEKANDPTNKLPHLTISQGDLAKQVKAINETGHASFDYSYMKPASLVGGNSSAPEKKAQGVETAKSDTNVVQPSTAKAADGVALQAKEQQQQKTERIVSETKKGRLPKAASADTSNANKTELAPARKAAADPKVERNAFDVQRAETAAPAKQEQQKTVDKSASATSSTSQCSMKKKTNQGKEEICLSCPGDAFSQVNECTANTGSAKDIAINLIAKNTQSKNGGKIKIDPSLLTTMAGLAKEGRTAVAEANVQGIETSPARKAATPPDLTALPEEDAKKLLETAEKGKVDELKRTWGQSASTDAEALYRKEDILRRIEEQQKEKQIKDAAAADAALKEKMKNRPKEAKSLQNTGDKGANDEIDADELAKTDRLACIYAGWAVQIEGKCKPISEKQIYDATGKKVTYSCRSKQKDEKAIYGENKDGLHYVLCNPMLFGLVNGKPICIITATNATEECARNAGTAESALEIARQNPEEYRALVRRSTTLCQSDETTLRTHFEKRGKNKAQVDYAINDLSMTCQHLRSRMAQIEEANKGAPVGGTR